MKKSMLWPIAILVVVAAVVGVIFWRHTISQPQLPPPHEIPQAPVAQVKTTHYPILSDTGSQPASEVLPSVQDSDHALLEALSVLLNRQTVTSIIYPEEIVRRIVVTIDNLPRDTIAYQLLPVKPVGGKFLTKGEGDTLSIAPENAERYASYVRIAQMMDTKKLVALYVRFYPMFQRAYQDLGYPQGYFNDRLIEVIDHLIDGPEVHAPVLLVQPHVAYRFEDQDLDALSAGDKMLIRMGSENAAKIKAKLREIRTELTKTQQISGKG